MEFDITQTNRAVDELLERTENPRHRYMLEVYGRHRNLEMAGRYPEIFAPEMTIAEPYYRFNYVGKVFDLNGRAEVEAVYREWTETSQCVFYSEDEELAVGDTMIVSRGTLYQQTPGTALVEEGLPADPEAHYLLKVREAMVWPYDEQCRLIGEDVWEFDPGAREVIELAPEEFLSAERAGELLDPYIKPMPELPAEVAASA